MAMTTFKVEEIYEMPTVGAATFMVGVDLAADLPSLSALEGTQVKLVYKDRATVTVVQRVEPPLPDHLPPYRQGERIGLVVDLHRGE